MDTRPTISFALPSGASQVIITRGNNVSDNAWLALHAALGPAAGGAPGALALPVERLLAERATIKKLVRAHGLAIESDQAVTAILEQSSRDRAVLREIQQGRLPPVNVDERLAGGRFTRELREFQVRDVGQLLAIPHGANFSVPGAGKTTAAYAIYEAERISNRVDRLLVVAPISAFGAWIEEAEDWFDPPLIVARFTGGRIPGETEVLLVNYERLVADYDAVSGWAQSHNTHVILDEAHRMKRGRTGQRGTACLDLAFHAKRRDILTGTPAPQAPRDFVALYDYLWPSHGLTIIPPDVTGTSPPPDAGPKVAAAIGPFFVRTTKTDLNLPPVERIPVTVRLRGLQKEIYMALRDRYAGQFAVGRDQRVDLARMGEVVMYLLEASTNPKLLTAGSLDGDDLDVFRHPPLIIEEGSELADLIARYNEYEVPAKFHELGRLVLANAEQGRKTLVWSNFVRNLRLLQRQFAALEPALIHGGVPPFASLPGDIARDTEIKRFRSDPDCLVLLANPAAMSEGISLHHECHDAIYLDRTFNAGQFLQSVDRIHRLGLSDDAETRITFLITADTIDEAVDRRVREKVARLSEMLDDPTLVGMALPDEEDYGPPIDDSSDDLEALFGHLRGADGK